ncbi:FAD-binding oxidoreductase [Luteimicrobium subarcticum]|uniref:Glycolate oxidase n=1 Tax=Luteimicrobium subarcticum TaxID=620910 RepID=A0A2M8WRW3_9MICO|nr:FAD-linked oxidase C-terminal domain-containing protein [Luteimicrobium subarcticum]PJI93677.1 glycolate oxidase [Luteimicrobium subarcticum]
MTHISRIASVLARRHPEIEVRPGSTGTAAYAHDAGTRPRVAHPDAPGPTVAFPATVEQVQDVVRVAASLGVAVVPRGAGTGLSGGASADVGQLVVSTDRLDRVLEVSPADELVVVEAGVVNADLDAHLAPHGLFYAPDPASYETSTIGGNVATNAGGLRCAKYGVTRESVLALDVVLADGSVLHTGHRSVKGVTGLDLTSLFVGSEGTLGIVVRATLRVRPRPVARRSLTAFFPDTLRGAHALVALAATPVRPAVVEFLDGPTLRGIDAHSGSDLSARGGSLVLVELDGYGIDEQTRDLTAALAAAGGTVRVESPEDAAHLWHLRRHGRGVGRGEPRWFVGEDVAVPRSVLPDVFAYLPELERRYGVEASAVAHAADGNLHPLLSRPVRADDAPDVVPPDLAEAATALVRFAVAHGGTVSGEHGIGTVKRDWARLELDDVALRAQHAVTAALDPHALLNPGKALPVLEPRTPLDGPVPRAAPSTHPDPVPTTV